MAAAGLTAEMPVLLLPSIDESLIVADMGVLIVAEQLFTRVEALRAEAPGAALPQVEQAAEAAQAAAGMQRYRIWRMYMAGMGYAFDRGWLRLAQVVPYKPESDVAMAVRP